MAIDWKQDPHRRFNPLTREWLLVSPHRTQRPWLGQVEKTAQAERAPYDPACYLCPGNARAGGHSNPQYTGTFVFENDFAALKPSTPAGEYREGELLLARNERGICRVVCFSPRHDLTVAGMDLASLRRVVDTWCEQFNELNSIEWMSYVQIFENRGEMMGASNPHPHCQIWASETIPVEVGKEHSAQKDYREAHGSCLLCDYARLEEQRGERVVCSNSSFLVVVPFWAVWPFETMVLSRRHVGAMDELTDAERVDLGGILKETTSRYDRVFDVPFPYGMGFHQRPHGGGAEWHFHAHYHPPLLRSATVRKFMVGYELLCNPQRDITAEAAAERLRSI